MRDREYNDTIAFLSQFFQFTDPDLETVELRAIANDGGGPRGRLFTRESEELVLFCKRQDVQGVATYFGCCTRRASVHAGRREHLSHCVGLWVDIDCYKLGISIDDAALALRQCPIPPTVITKSGGGVHGYWLFREPMPLPMPAAGQPDEIKERIDAALLQLAGVFCGDPVPAQLAAVMRLPGTHNSKSGEMIECVVLEATWTRYELEDIEEELFRCRPLILAPVPENQPNKRDAIPEGDPFAAFAKQYAFKPPVDVEAVLKDMVYGDRLHGVHLTQRTVSGSLANMPGWTDEAIVDLLLAHTTRVAPPGNRWNWAREEKNLFGMVRGMRDRRRAEGKDPYPQAPAAPAEPVGPPEPPKVVQLRPNVQAPPEVADSPPKIPAAAMAGDYPMNDLGNAMRLLDRHRAVMRYVLGIGWHIWDRRRFVYDAEQVKAGTLAHNTVKDMLLQAFKAGGDAKSREKIVKFAIQCANSGRLANMLHEARVYVAHNADDLDRDEWLINCLNGTLDLRTGLVRPHDQADLLTKLTGIAYDADAACPQWEKFLLEIFDGDLEVIGFLQRALGYSLTGSTREQVLFILHGQGSNGKTVLIETVAAVIGEYVRHSPADTWVSRPAGAQSNDLAALVGARFVSVIETERDRHLAEALVKQATGGDAITAKFHYKEYFTYWPQFKLWFATNHKPRIRGSDYAIWRRIMMLPFNVTFYDADKAVGDQKVKDPDLKNKLKGEHAGILAWMVRGCLEWQRTGLRPPEAVRAAVEAYRDSEDHVTQFLREACNEGRGISCSVNLLYAGYQVWCEEADQAALSKTEFGKNLDERGFPPGKRTMRARMRDHIDLKQEYRDAAEAKMADSANGA